MNQEYFAKVAESLRKYQRAELKEFEVEIGEKPIDQLYVDPLPANAILNSVLSSGTTFLLGRKGTGKSTIFAKAQSVLRKKKDVISIYIDVKSLYDIMSASEPPEHNLTDLSISSVIYRSHILRKTILGNVIAELTKEISKVCDELSVLARLQGKKRKLEELKLALRELGEKSKNATLEKTEIPILQTISREQRSKQQIEKSQANNLKGSASIKLSPKDAELAVGTEGSSVDFDKTLDDIDIYDKYADVVLRSFPFGSIIDEIQELLATCALQRLIIFFDDFSELKLVDQRLFVDVVLSPLNNSSKETIKLKIAGYPGRIYYGKIDPTKVDTIALGFSELYEATEVQEMERAATDYATRLITKRFEAFGLKIDDYFDLASGTSSNTPQLEDYMQLLFRASFNVPRIIGHLLHQCYLDRISKSQKITLAAIRLAAKKYYENTISKYFDRLNRYALEPFENKLDRNNQRLLLNHLIEEARSVRKRILSGEVGGNYFTQLTNPPISHFIVSPELEDVFSSLESNFFITRYKNTRDKQGKAVIVYAFFLGLTESERMAWGYPDGRSYRNYFVQRCFDYTRAVHSYLSARETIKCKSCGQCFPMEDQEKIEYFKWRCPECNEPSCSVVSLSDDFRAEVEALDREIMLEPVELEILSTLNDANKKMPAGEISTFIDATHQLIGHRTSKLRDMGLVNKSKDIDNRMKSEITERSQRTYFASNEHE